MSNLHVTKFFLGAVLSTLQFLLLYTDSGGLQASATTEHLNTIIISYSSRCINNKETDDIVLRSINAAASTSIQRSRDSEGPPLKFGSISYSDSEIAMIRSYAISGELGVSTRSSDSCSFVDTWLKYTGVQLLTTRGNCERIGKDDIMYNLGNEECVLSYELDRLRRPSGMYINTLNDTAYFEKIEEGLLANDYYFSKSWYFNEENPYNINAQGAWKISSGGSGSRDEQPDNTVAVVDFGFMSDHPDLATQWYENPDEACYQHGENGIDEDSNGLIDDCNGWNTVKNSNNLAGYSHGTKVAGVLGSATDNLIGVSSICHKCRMLPVTVGGSVSSEITGVNYAISRGVKVINLSVGGPRSQSEFHMFAANPSVLFVVSSGNESCNIDLIETEGCKDKYGNGAGYPAALSDVLNNLISVGSYTPNGTISGFSNYGAKRVQVMAPGSSVFTTGFSGTTPNYTKRSGTSYAAPMVASIAGLIHQRYPNLSACQLREILVITCRSNPALIGKSSCHGMVDAGDAVFFASMVTRNPSILRCSDVGNCTTRDCKSVPAVRAAGPQESDQLSAVETPIAGLPKVETPIAELLKVDNLIAELPAVDNPIAKLPKVDPSTAKDIHDENDDNGSVADTNDSRKARSSFAKTNNSNFAVTPPTGNTLATTKHYLISNAMLLKPGLAAAGKIAIISKLIQLISPLIYLMIKVPMTMIVPKKLTDTVPTMLMPNTTLSMILNPVSIDRLTGFRLTAADYGFLKDAAMEIIRKLVNHN